jgi:plasmid stability protein
MTRKMIDCRTTPSERDCTLTIAGAEDEVLAAAAHHAVTEHGHADEPELRDLLRGALTDEPETVSEHGAFVQLFEFHTDRIDEWSAIQERFRVGIGAERATRWSILGTDRDRPGTFVAIVEFPSYPAAMGNSGHAATQTFLKELQEICTDEPGFRNLDVRLARPY